MARLERNAEARKAWCLRHGIDPDRIIDEPYPGMRLPDGSWHYELQRLIAIDVRYESPGEPVYDTVEVTVPGDDPMPPQYLITGLPPDPWKAALADHLPDGTACEPDAVADYIATLQRRLIERS